MTGQDIKQGSRVKVTDRQSLFYGRTGLITASVDKENAGEGHDDGPFWLVIFDWPLGGIAGRAVLGQSYLELEQWDVSGDPRLKLQT